MFEECTKSRFYNELLGSLNVSFNHFKEDVLKIIYDPKCFGKYDDQFAKKEVLLPGCLVKHDQVGTQTRMIVCLLFVLEVTIVVTSKKGDSTVYLGKIWTMHSLYVCHIIPQLV